MLERVDDVGLKIGRKIRNVLERKGERHCRDLRERVLGFFQTELHQNSHADLIVEEKKTFYLRNSSALKVYIQAYIIKTEH